jgi:hypothetical protein
MPFRKVRGGRYNDPRRDAEAKARARKRADRPKRDILAIRTALNTLKLNYCQEVSFWNPLHKGRRGTWDAGLQWVDFVVKPKGKQAFVILHDDPRKRFKSYEKIAFQVKQEGLNQRNVPYLILPKGMTSQEYQIKITFFIRKLKGDQ